MTETLAVLDVVVGAGILVTATVALMVKDRLLTVLMFLGLGVLLAVLWARLSAPDLAIAEAAIASGVTGALLISAIGALHPPAPRSRSSAPIGTLASVGLVLGASAGLGWAMVSAHRRGLARLSSQDTAAGGASDAVANAVVDHPITAVLLQFRSLDTLLEVAVLSAAALAVLTLPREGAGAALGVRRDRGELFEGFARVIAPVVVLLSGWLLVAGSTQPGGAFQAGAVVTGAILLAHLAGRLPMESRAVRRWTLPVVVLGPLAFLALAWATVVVGDGWLVVSPPWGGTVVVVLEAVLAISIGASLAAAFLAARTPLSLLDADGDLR